MRCDHVPPRLTSVNPVARWSARRHLAECPICGRDRAIIEGLGDIPPLPARYRSLWLAAAVPRPRTFRRTLALVAAVLVGAITGLLAIPLLAPRHDRPPIVTNNPESPVIPLAQRELDGLRAALDPLDGELADLRRRADLLDARRDADRLLATYAWPERSGM
jgi:hypothetical protein